MKALIPLTFLIVVALSAVSFTNTRVFSVGTNPYISYEMYPQDVLNWDGSFLYYYPQYEKQPWWGDIDEPANKPNATTYTTTGNEEINGQANFQHSGKIHTVDNAIGYAHRFGDNLMANFDLNYDVDGLRNRAEGNMTDSDNGGYIPFDYSLRHTLNDIYLNSIMGFKVGAVPVGLRLQFGYENTLALKQELTYSKNGQSHTSKRALWGWATVGCNHVFGPRSTEGDAWLQREYSQGPLYRLDFQGGATLPRIKFGGYFQYKFGHQDQYQWQSDTINTTGDPVLDNSFQGEYVKSNWSKTTRDAMIQLYGNINWRRGDRYALNTFISVDYEGSTFGDALSENLAIVNDAKEIERGLSVEFNPNINLRLGERFHYIDAALLLEYGFTRLNNTYERWVGGGTQETYWNTSVNGEDENIWEQFSYANENYFDVGADISAMFPLVNRETSLFAFGFILFFDTRFTYQTKYYGNNTDNGTEITFTVDNRRENFTREIWFNSALMLQYVRRPFHVRFQVTEPFLYSLMPRTTITDKDDKVVLYEHERQPLWLSQQGFGLGLFFGYEVTLPFLRR